jgi:hypothetical protein
MGIDGENTFRDKLSSVGREQIKRSLVARGHKFVVDEQLCFNWASHFAQSLSIKVNYELQNMFRYTRR